MIYDQLAGERLFEPEPPRGVEDTHALPAVDESLDLTRWDYLATNTDKVPPEDDVLPQPPQDPRWVPASVVDADGRPA